MESLLYATSYKINEHITVKIPTVGEIKGDEDNYYSTVSLITATPYDLMAPLADVGIDFTAIDEWELFLILFRGFQDKNTSLVFENLNFTDFEIAENKENGERVLVNRATGAVIDRAIHERICNVLRKILFIDKNNKRPANDEAKEYLIEKARKKMKRRSRKAEKSPLDDFIISLVNTSEFPYNYSSVLGITIYQFNASLHQVMKKVNFDKLMIGCYAGTVDTKNMAPEELSWIKTE